MRQLGEGHFLGFCFRRSKGTDDDIDIGLSKKAAKRLGETIRAMTPGNWGRSLASCMAALSRYLSGWMAHFRLCMPAAAEDFKRFDAHIRRRLRAIIVRQKKRPRFLYRHLLRRWGRAARTPPEPRIAAGEPGTAPTVRA